MAIISNSTFDALSRRVNVRLQQGVPIVDADWNEMDDIRKFEVQAFLKWFVGDGVPDGNDGFRIDAITPGPPPNDFRILAGVAGAPDGLGNVGRILVNGTDVMIDADVQYTAQLLHASNGAAADAEAARLGVPKIDALPLPAADGTWVAYLDVWERIVTPAEDPSLVLPGLGTESCARIRREWAVRTRAGATAPAPGEAEYSNGHDYYALATLARRLADPSVNPGDIADRREQRLLVPPSSLIPDLFGTAPADYRRGQGRPAISLREVVNALIRGELPCTPDTAVSAGATLDVLKRGWLLDGTNGLVAVWTSNRDLATNQVFAARLDLANAAGGFSAAQQITTGTRHGEPHTALLPNGDLVLVYQGGVGATSDIFLRRAPLAGLAAAAEQIVAQTAGVIEALPFVVVSGPLAVVFYRQGTLRRWHYRRYRHTDNTWLDVAPVQIQTLPANADDAQSQFHAARDAAGNIWLAFQQGAVATSAIGAMRLNPSTGVIDQTVVLDSNPAAADDQPFMLCAASGEAWVFWHSAAALQQARFTGGAWQAPQVIAGTNGATDSQPAAVEDGMGGIWLFWSHDTPPEDIHVMRRSPDTGGWGQPRAMTISPSDDSAPHALVAPNQAIWIAWSSDRTGSVQPYFKRLVTTW